MSRAQVVWAVLHDLGRSGVPVALERMVRWQAGSHPDVVEVHLISRRDGALRTTFEAATASVTVLGPAHGRSRTELAALALDEVGAGAASWSLRSRAARLRLRHLPTPDVVLVQGAGAWPTFSLLEPSVGRAAVVLHLHELEVALSRSGLGGATGAPFERSDRILAVSRPVADLALRLGAPAAALDLVSGSVDPPPAGWSVPLWPGAGREVVSIGSAEWRKGTDLAVAAAHELHRSDAGATWHWIGAPEESSWSFAVGTHDPLVRHGAAAAPWQVVPDPAALVVPSREDPLPLVALEAGARGVPVVATRSGGLTELLADGRGTLVDPLDIAGLAAGVRGCLDDPEAAALRATALRDHVRREHATDVVGPRWLDALRRQR